MREWFTIEEINKAAKAIIARTATHPRVGIILGSGLGGLADAVENPDSIPFSEIPFWASSTVQGHVGRLVIGSLEEKPVMVMQGRIHYYEGYSMHQVTLPIRVMQMMGIQYLIVTNAAGAINPGFRPGDVMLINDHINLMGMNGLNPLRGPNLVEFGERFPDMSRAYDRDLLALARTVAAENKVSIQEGVYVGLAGPTFETPADLRFLKIIGADAVGMSTVPEVTVAVHGKTRVLGISGISNAANLDGSTVTTHEEVLEAGKILVPKMTTIIRGVLEKL